MILDNLRANDITIYTAVYTFDMIATNRSTDAELSRFIHVSSHSDNPGDVRSAAL